MTLPVFWVPSLEGATDGGSVEVTGDEARHAVVVRRTRVGELVVLTDGAGIRATAQVASTAKTMMTCAVLSVATVPRETPRVVVVQAIPKGDRGELAVEMLTEVGVDVVVPWAAERCVAQWRGDRVAKGHSRWASTAREAAKQARRPWFPEVAAMAGTPEVVTLAAEADLAVLLHESADVALVDLDVPAEGTVVVVVGPEGGISEAELEAFSAAGISPVRLGSSVLRTSTAGVVAVSALLSRTPRWG